MKKGAAGVGKVSPTAVQLQWGCRWVSCEAIGTLMDGWKERPSDTISSGAIALGSHVCEEEVIHRRNP